MTVLLTGSNGFLGGILLSTLLEACRNGVRILKCGPSDVAPAGAIHFAPTDLPSRLLRLFDSAPLTHIIHVAAMASAAECESRPSDAWDANVRLTKSLVELAKEKQAHLTYISTDLVFDGVSASSAPLDEGVTPNPQSTYARTKLAGEEACLGASNTAVVRISLLYGHGASPGSRNVLGWMEDTFRSNAPLVLFRDEFRTPIHVGDAATRIATISSRTFSGIWHCGGPERLSRVEFGRILAAVRGFDSSLIVERSRAEVPSSPARPEDVSLNSAKLCRETGPARTAAVALSETAIPER